MCIPRLLSCHKYFKAIFINYFDPRHNMIKTEEETEMSSGQVLKTLVKNKITARE